MGFLEAVHRRAQSLNGMLEGLRILVGARGFMQVMPFWARLIGDGDVSKLFHLQTNLRFGCVILRHYLDREQGNLFMGLGRYNGSRGFAPYPEAVLAASKKWQIDT